jgi:hypothetical protein
MFLWKLFNNFNTAIVSRWFQVTSKKLQIWKHAEVPKDEIFNIVRVMGFMGMNETYA